MGQPVLQAKDLYFSYDGKGNALDGVSLDIFAGERIAVLGPNGAGKSTFFLCLNGVLTPERGEILLDGRATGRRDRKRLCERAGIVFQNADDQIIASTVAAEVSFGPMNCACQRTRSCGVWITRWHIWISAPFARARRTSCPAGRKSA